MTSPRSHPVPYSVRESDVLREAADREARVLSEACQHHHLSVRRCIRDLSDHETLYGVCICGARIVRVTWFGADPRVEDRPMTDQEWARFRTHAEAMDEQIGLPDRVIRGERYPRND